MATESADEKAGVLTRARDYIAEVVDELKKVSWPDWPTLKNATAVVIVFVLLIAFIIWVMDLGVRSVLNIILNLFT